MKRCVTGLLLWLMSVSVFADTMSKTDASTDLSIKYLGQIFGDVPGSLVGSGTGLISGVFEIFNEGVMAIAAIWLLYTITQVLIVSAVNDHPSKSIKNWALWLRITAGFGMLVPGPSGYCIAQDVMMKVAVGGVNLANRTWNYALDYLAEGNAIFVPPVKTGDLLSSLTDKGAVQSKLAAFIGGDSRSPLTTSMAYKLLNSEVCMFASNRYNRAYNDNAHPIAQQGAKIQYRMISVPPSYANQQLIGGTGTIYFPGYGDTDLNQPIMPTLTIGDNSAVSVEPPSSHCGSITIAQVPAYDHMLYNQAYAAITQAALNMMPLAKQIANNVTARLDQIGTTPNHFVSTVPSIDDDFGASHIFRSVIDYLRLVQPLANYKGDSANTTPDFVAQARQQGWFNAGGFYWDLVRWNTRLTTVEGDPSSFVPQAKAPSSDFINGDSIQPFLDQANTVIGSGMWGDAQQQVADYATGRGNNNSHHKSVTGRPFPVAFGILTGGIDRIISKVNDDMAPGNMKAYNPMLISYDVGKTALGAAGWMWTIMIAVLTPLSIALGVCDSANPGNVVFRGITTWLTPLVVTTTGFLFAAGVMLTFYVPMYPYLLFLFGVVGWLLYVVEAMVAAPLVCFGMTHPEGHDFMGKAEQSLMLALGVFLRPTLMVLGYIVGMLMVFVTTGFLNLVLGQVFMSTFAQRNAPDVGDGFDGAYSALAGNTSKVLGGQFTGNPISDVLCVPIILTLYSMIMLEVVNQCFSAIHQVPNMVLRWIGGPQEPSTATQHAQAIKGALGSAGQQAGRLGGEMVSSQSQAGGQVVRDNDRRKELDRQKAGREGDSPVGGATATPGDGASAHLAGN